MRNNKKLQHGYDALRAVHGTMDRQKVQEIQDKICSEMAKHSHFTALCEKSCLQRHRSRMM